MKIEIGSLVKFYIILLLNEGQKHGYTLMKELEEKLNRKISASQVYPFLKILKKNKLIKIEVIKEREKKVYKLTSKGKEFVNNFLHKSGNLLAAVIKSFLLLTLTHPGSKISKILCSMSKKKFTSAMINLPFFLRTLFISINDFFC